MDTIARFRDRLFSRLPPELHRPAYGLIQPIGTHNIVSTQRCRHRRAGLPGAPVQ